MAKSILGSITSSLFSIARATNTVNQASRGPNAFGAHLIRKSIIRGAFKVFKF